MQETLRRTRNSGRLSATAGEVEALLRILRKELLLALESADAAVFSMKLQWILESAGEVSDLVLMSGLDSDGKTALHIAVQRRFEEAVKLLVASGKVDLLATAGDGGWSALHTAVEVGDVGLVRALLSTRGTGLAAHRVLAALKQPTASRSAPTALHMAVRRSSAACAVVLLQAANELLRRQPRTRTPSAGEETQDEDEEEEEEKVVTAAARVERQEKGDFHGQAGEGSRRLNRLRDGNGDTPLHCAVKTNNYAMARLLCSYGARPRHSHNCLGQTPLALAKYVLRNSKMTRLLASFSPPATTGCLEDDVEEEGEATEGAWCLRDTAEESAGGGGRRRRQPTSTAAEPPSPAKTTAASRGSVAGRPYLHREVKSVLPQGTLDTRVAEADSLATSRLRSNSLKVGRRDWATLRPRTPGLLPRQAVRRELVHQPRPVSLKARRKASLMDPTEYYPMASPRRGICVVINNMTYWHPQFRNRGGCDKDEKRVEQVFCDLGFLVKVLRNLSSGEMHSELAFIGRKADHTAYDAFVAVIMAHGGPGELYGVHGDAFPVHQLTLDFTAERCPSLAGKPKLFFIQACRGDDYQLGCALPVNGAAEDASPAISDSAFSDRLPFGATALDVEATAAAEAAAEETMEEEPAIIAAKLPRRQRLVPSFADFLMSYATLAGFKAQRDSSQGSVYVQTLCHFLEIYGRSRSLLDIVTLVHREVSEKVFREAEAPDQDGTVFQQMPEVRHTLTRRVQFV